MKKNLMVLFTVIAWVLFLIFVIWQGISNLLEYFNYLGNILYFKDYNYYTFLYWYTVSEPIRLVKIFFIGLRESSVLLVLGPALFICCYLFTLILWKGKSKNFILASLFISFVLFNVFALLIVYQNQRDFLILNDYSPDSTNIYASYLAWQDELVATHGSFYKGILNYFFNYRDGLYKVLDIFFIVMIVITTVLLNLKIDFKKENRKKATIISCSTIWGSFLLFNIIFFFVVLGQMKAHYVELATLEGYENLNRLYNFEIERIRFMYNNNLVLGLLSYYFNSYNRIPIIINSFLVFFLTLYTIKFNRFERTKITFISLWGGFVFINFIMFCGLSFPIKDNLYSAILDGTISLSALSFSACLHYYISFYEFNMFVINIYIILLLGIMSFFVYINSDKANPKLIEESIRLATKDCVNENDYINKCDEILKQRNLLWNDPYVLQAIYSKIKEMQKDNNSENEKLNSDFDEIDKILKKVDLNKNEFSRLKELHEDLKNNLVVVSETKGVELTLNETNNVIIEDNFLENKDNSLENKEEKVEETNDKVD